MAEERPKVTSINQLLFQLDLDLDRLQRTRAKVIKVTEGVDVTVPRNVFQDFAKDVESLLRRKYPDCKVYFYIAEKEGKVNIRGYVVQDKVIRDVHELVHVINDYLERGEETNGWFNDVEVDLDPEEYDDLLWYLRRLEGEYGMKVELRAEEHEWFVKVVGFRTTRRC